MKIEAFWKQNRYELDLQTEVINTSLHQITLTFPDGKVLKGVGVDYFDAILQIRAIIEPHHWLLAINASRLDGGKNVDTNVNSKQHEALMTLIVDKQIRTVHVFDAADLTQIGTIEYQARSFNEKLFEAQRLIEAKASVRKETKQANKADANRNMPWVAPLLAVISSLYPLTFQYLNLSNITVVFGWAAVGLVIYGVVIAINVENVIVLRKSTLGLVFSIILPGLVTLGAVYLALLNAGNELQKILDTFQ